MEECKVSICCLTYNHEKYIRDALEGFVNQKTNFKYEVLIHDDASTDNTAKIIKEYAEKYPEIIKPIYQKENQLSKGKSVQQFNYERAQGKYITLCEGDDYYIKPYKLQKQVDFLETHLNCSLSVHAAEKILDGANNGYVRPNDKDKYFSTEEIILGGGGLFATNSMMFRKELIESLPNFYYLCNVNDYPLMIYLSLKGACFYIDECLSAYRVMSEGSWTSYIVSNKKALTEHFGNITQMLHLVDKYTEFTFSQAIEKRILIDEWKILLEYPELKKMREGKYTNFYNSLSNLQKAKLFIKQYFPILVRWKNYLKEKIN